MNNYQPFETEENEEFYDSLASMPVAMAYVPWQTFHHSFDLNKALSAGTIFPELYKPFTGRRGI